MALGLSLEGDVIECHPNSLAAISLLVREEKQMSVDSFIGAVKVKRDETLEKFSETLANQNGHLDQDDAIRFVDQLVGGVLDIVNDQYEEIITAEADDDGNAIVSCASDLSTLYFEEVSN